MLKILSDPTCDLHDVESARDEVYKRVPGGSTSAAGVWLRRLSRASAMTLGGRHALTHIAQIVRERLEQGPTADGSESDSGHMYDGESERSEQDEEDRPSPKRGVFDPGSLKSSGASGSKSKAATRKAQLDTLLSSAMMLFEVGQTINTSSPLLSRLRHEHYIFSFARLTLRTHCMHHHGSSASLGGWQRLRELSFGPPPRLSPARRSRSGDPRERRM